MPNLRESNPRFMRRVAWFTSVLLVLCVGALIVWAGARVRANSVASVGSYRSEWSPEAAASYLDSREAWWQNWPDAQLHQGTFCISCHTTLPYALVRPGLRSALGETELTDDEKKMLASIEKRVADWQEMSPYYTDTAHAAPSHATEAVLNAMILAKYSEEQPQLLPVARHAFDEAWALQQTTGENVGGWEWQDFHEAPWESPESAYQGAAMMAIAVGSMPAAYASDPAVRDHMEHLRQYLLVHYAAEPTMNQLYVLWASSRVPGLLSASQRADLIKKVASLQRSDGGWSLPALDEQKAIKPAMLDLFKRANHVDDSDGVATGLVVLALEEDGVKLEDPALKRGLAWLETHQRGEGSWWASSLNGFRNPTTGMGRFMSDAATGYAVLALERAPNLSKRNEKTIGARLVPDAGQSVRASSSASW
jgi:squalene-hopene/tetraprenyl-beta-curcumene cyclase